MIIGIGEVWWILGYMAYALGFVILKNNAKNAMNIVEKKKVVKKSS